MKRHTTIYIEEDEEITSIVERIKKTPASEIALVVPRRSFLAQGVVNLKILKSQSEKTGKKLMLVTRDVLCRTLAEKVGLSTDKKLDAETLKRTRIDTPRSLQEVENKKPIQEKPKTERRPAPVFLKEKKVLEKKGSGSMIDGLGGPVGGVSIDGAVPGSAPVDLRLVQKMREKEQLPAKQQPAEEERELPPVEKEEEILPLAKKQSGLKEIFKKKDSLVIFLKGLLEKKKIFGEFLAKFRKQKMEEQDEEEETSDSSGKLLKPVLQRDVGIRLMQEGKLKSRKEKERRIELLSGSNVRLFSIFGLVLAGVLFWVLALILPRAEVIIVPRQEAVLVNFKLKTDLDQEEVDFRDRVIPVKEIGGEFFARMQAEATGEAKDLADEQGLQKTLVVMNEYSASFEILVAQTRFVSEEGLVFRSTEEIKVPGYTKRNGEIIPGEAGVAVVADKKTDPSAVPQGKFTIPGLKGDDRYTKIYAKAGDLLKEEGTKAVTEDDIRKAREKVGELLESEIEKKAKEKSLDLRIVKESIDLSGIKWESDRRIGSRADNFWVEGRVVTKALAYSKKDLEKMVDHFLEQEVAKEQKLAGEPEIKISGFKLDKGWEINEIKVNAQSQKLKEINIESMKEGILGLSKKETLAKLSALSQVEEVKVECWPFWVKNIPDNENRVKIEVKY